jgi:hypothetical protein
MRSVVVLLCAVVVLQACSIATGGAGGYSPPGEQKVWTKVGRQSGGGHGGG